MRRLLLSVFSLLVLLVAVGSGIVWYLLNDEAFLKKRLSAFVLEQSGRELNIDGGLRVSLGRATSVEAEGIRFGNADWADEPDMARVGRARVVIDVPSLFGGTPIIPMLSIEGCALHLVEREDGVANWDLRPSTADLSQMPEGDGVPLVLLDAEIRKCAFTHSAPGREQALQVNVHEWSQQLHEDRRLQLRGAGQVDGEPVAIEGFLLPAGALLSGGQIEHELKINIGETSLRSAGTIRDAATGQGANIDLHFQGPEIARIFSFLGLPPSSNGPFDFDLSLDTQGQMTRLKLDGDLGELQAHAEGELNRLKRPSEGQVRGTLEGPDLARLGNALGVEGLLPADYKLDADVSFEPGLLRFRLLELKMPADRLAVLGALGTAEGLAGTDLDVTAEIQDLGHWAGAWGQPVQDIGAVALIGRLQSDANGSSSIRARAEHAGSTLTVVGGLGVLGESLQPDLKVDFHSDDPRALASFLGDFTLPDAPMAVVGHFARSGDVLILDSVDLALGSHAAHVDGRVNLTSPYSGTEVEFEVRSPDAAELGVMFGRDDLPAAPFTLTGRAARPGKQIRFDGVDLDLAGHHLRVNGTLNPEEQYAGSEFEVQLDTPDVQALALMFGEQGWPKERMMLSGVLKPEGEGLRFKTEKGGLGDIRLAVDGHIPSLDKPRVLDINFDIELPRLSLLAFLAPDAALPDLPFTAVGRLQGQEDKTHLQDLRLGLGNLTATVSGDLYADQTFALLIDAVGQDASVLAQWVGRPLVPEPFSLRTRLAGNPTGFALQDIDVKLGKSLLTGDLKVGLGTPMTLSGSLFSPRLDLSKWLAEEKGAPAPEPEPASAFVFDDTKVMWIADYGVDADVAVGVAELDLGNTRFFDIELGVLLKDQKLELAPFSLRGGIGGTLSGYAVLDDEGSKPVMDIEMSAKNLSVGLTAAPGQDRETIPRMDMALSLRGSGFTRRELASALNGEVRLYLGPGQIASSRISLLFSDFLTELFQELNPLAKSRDYTGLECAVWAADIVEGRVTVDPMITNMEDFTVFSKGDINLQSEKINLSFATKPRKGLGITPGTVINTLIKVGGTLKKPAIELDPAGAIVSGTTAFATGGLSILAKGFSDRFLSSKDPCGDARKQLVKRDGSPGTEAPPEEQIH